MHCVFLFVLLSQEIAHNLDQKLENVILRTWDAKGFVKKCWRVKRLEIPEQISKLQNTIANDPFNSLEFISFRKNCWTKFPPSIAISSVCFRNVARHRRTETTVCLLFSCVLVCLQEHFIYLRQPEQVSLARVLIHNETLFADIPNLNVECAIRMSEDRKLWRSSRPSLRCQPLLGGVTIK